MTDYVFRITKGWNNDPDGKEEREAACNAAIKELDSIRSNGEATSDHVLRWYAKWFVVCAPRYLGLALMGYLRHEGLA